ncbi:MAG: iron dicitrate transport regulator FecR, partial [Bacteroides acidifaciens]|nr:iron dicitrate transport regulator FecR [Bacteroides acidifaciens]
MEKQNPESLLRKAQALGDDIKEMEAINVPTAYRKAQIKIRNRRKAEAYNLLMRYAAFLAIPLLPATLTLGYLY